MRLSIFWKIFISAIVLAALGIGVVGGFGFHFARERIRERIDQHYLNGVRESRQDIPKTRFSK